MVHLFAKFAVTLCPVFKIQLMVIWDRKTLARQFSGPMSGNPMIQFVKMDLSNSQTYFQAKNLNFFHKKAREKLLRSWEHFTVSPPLEL